MKKGERLGKSTGHEGVRNGREEAKKQLEEAGATVELK